MQESSGPTELWTLIVQGRRLCAWSASSGRSAAGSLKILRGVYVLHPDASFLECPASYSAGFLAASELREHARRPETEISNRFLDEALARGDQCYAIRDGDVLAAYGWYSFGRTPVGISDLVLRFSEDYVYMYKGFTDARYRGQRLHAIGMTRAPLQGPRIPRPCVLRGNDEPQLAQILPADGLPRLRLGLRAALFRALLRLLEPRVPAVRVPARTAGYSFRAALRSSAGTRTLMPARSS